MTDVAARFVVLLPCLAWRVLDLLEVNRKIATHLSGAKNLEFNILARSGGYRELRHH